MLCGCYEHHGVGGLHTAGTAVLLSRAQLLVQFICSTFVVIIYWLAGLLCSRNRGTLACDWPTLILFRVFFLFFSVSLLSVTIEFVISLG